MMLGKNADLNAYKHLKTQTVVCSTRVEPPLHPNAGEKIIEDFKFKIPEELPPISSIISGYFSYDIIRYIERI